MPTLRFYDEFTSNNNTDIDGTSPSDTGSSWSKVYATGAQFMRDGTAGFFDNAYPNATVSNQGFMYAALKGSAYENDQEVEIRISTINSTASLRTGIFLRRQDDNNFIIAAMNFTDTILHIRVAGSSTLTTLSSSSFSNTDIAKLTVYGSTVTLYKNGTSIYSASHTVPASGTPGLSCGTSPGWSGTAQGLSTSVQRYAYFKAWDEPPAATFVPSSQGLLGNLSGNLSGNL